ncbi:hypothetical protein [Frigoriglobus tundricola]|uniref:Uncharacterized protein n=1 Tax=Frigoriglobus tundricola TaxID=2774151 RepID=A0A6M5YWC8_9BACT|nr:hypothetical protein [Frigoriglobus tundricola]QJW97232.1 hypothetical protein FTUN_4801 [Frigoriglobus tundricola]
MWYRVFGTSEVEPAPAALAEHLHAAGLAVEPHFKGDDLGWTTGELRLSVGSPVYLARYLTKEDDLRDDLNAHAAELETMDYSPNSGPLMARVVQTKQLVTLRKPVDAADEVLLEKVLDAAARFLAAATDGVYQIDGRGWFAASGELLVQEY